MFSTAYLDQFGLCRLCLIRERVNIPIFEEAEGGNFPFINVKINTCLPVKVTEDDTLPKKICVDCYYKLESFYQFYNVSADAEKQLLSWIEEGASAESEPETKIHLAKKLQQAANTAAEDNGESLADNALNCEFEVINVKKEREDGVEGSEEFADHEDASPSTEQCDVNIKQSDDCDSNSHDRFAGASCREGSEGSDEQLFVAKGDSKKRKAGNKSAKRTVKRSPKKIAKPRDAEGKLIVRRGKRLKKNTFFYKKVGEEYECLECQERCRTLKNVRIHFRTNHAEKYIFKCNECDKTFLKSTEFKAHRREHGIDESVKIFSCDKCDYVSSSKHAVEIHELRRHSKAYVFDCDVCKKKFKTKDDIRLHMPTHDATEHMCDICGQFYPSQHSLVRHRRVRHINVYDFQCPLCNIKLISQVNLDNHIRENHNPNDPIKCGECSQEFKRKRYLIRHQKRVHQKLEKAHLCTQCGKSFVCMNTFRIHYLTHTKIRPYVCNVCGDSFSQRSSMMLHWKRQHPDAEEPPPKVILTNVFENYQLNVGEQNYNRIKDRNLGNGSFDT